MRIDGTHYRSIWLGDDQKTVKIIEQRLLPHELKVVDLKSREDAAIAIKDMWVRGAPLIGATAAYGVALAMADDPSDANLETTWELLHETRPTAINLRWALNRTKVHLRAIAPGEREAAAFELAAEICDEDVEINRSIGENGLKLIEEIASKKAPGETINILTHCNAGWLATVDWGTATSPIYHAVEKGLKVHVWVDETRPRNQGAQLTSWEMASHGVPHTLIVDNAGGHLMQHGQVDLVIVGTDRTTAQGDVCNKIGTYLKALAAKDNNVPFFVALPSPTIDWTVSDGVKEIPIEERDGREVTHVYGKLQNGKRDWVQISPDATQGGNPAFDVTPARLITGLITERGVCPASREGLEGLFPEHK
ncbi:S-methyl-5-thioribose-1-phosphate isomerase [Maritalea porphyrae]|uniref:S-methyl-5-thioribose-1-phosphate isomerase n=1 Tax=Maritalea porphyrae TaxID=880732 RepID=UPI0022AECC3F|nr:S-methyl-5-thioribose-1-phosphate isomerase [Maritalea porphyrae]MCZ4274168.1 S-methyl-5-thioribose-1-phosphate isomerase [Maritalea porphyrae]